MSKHYLLLAAWLVVNASTISPASACTTILVGRDATADGSTIIARNNDEHDALSVNSLYRHAKSRGPHQFQGNAGGFSYTSKRGALAYTALPYARYVGSSRISYEEAGINEHGLTISATETIYNSDRALAVDPYVESGITEDGIASVILAQAKSAREGVRLLGRIVERQGAGEGFGVAFGDRHGIWYFETASGHHWLARKLPHHAYFVSANQGRFQEVNLQSARTTLASPRLLRFAAQHQLWQPRTEAFNFLRSFVADTPHDATYNYPRVERLISRYSGLDVSAQAPYFPVFLKPSRKLTVWDVADGLRDHYQGTSNDPYQTRNPTAPYRPMAVLRTAHSHLLQQRPDLPKDIGTVLYLALGMEDLAPYLPASDTGSARRTGRQRLELAQGSLPDVGAHAAQRCQTGHPGGFGGIGALRLHDRIRSAVCIPEWLYAGRRHPYRRRFRHALPCLARQHVAGRLQGWAATG